MTTATPDRTVTPLYDQELEEVLTGDVECGGNDHEGCGRPATHLVGHDGGCYEPVCGNHLRIVREWMKSLGGFECTECDSDVPNDRADIRPI